MEILKRFLIPLDEDSSLDAKYRQLLADEVLKKLGLDICADVRVISCSGGQKKCLSIAQEVTKPSLLILDEPTSGLDSKTCFQILHLLQQLTESSNGETQSSNGETQSTEKLNRVTEKLNHGDDSPTK